MATKYDLEDRLINFAVQIIDVCTKLDNSKAATHIASQMLRSGTAPALNYGEAQSSESRKDFIHKIKIILKELRETLVSLKIIERAQLSTDNTIVSVAQKESIELISIFMKSVETATRNMLNQKSAK